MKTSKLLSYPVYALSAGDDHIVTSGGGGGDEYGIGNKIEVYTLLDDDKSNRLNLKAFTSDQQGVLDSAVYNAKRRLWIGCMNDYTLFFTYTPKSKIEIFGKIRTDFAEKDPRQAVCRFGRDTDIFITGGTDGTVRVWKVAVPLISKLQALHENDGDDANPEPCETTSTVAEEQRQDEGVDNTQLVNGKDSMGGGESKPSAKENGRAGKMNTDGALVDGSKPVKKSEKEPFPGFKRMSTGGDELATSVCSYSEHSSGINDCDLSIDGKVAISVCNRFLVVYHLDPIKCLLKHEGKSDFKFVRFLRHESPEYYMTTLEWRYGRPGKATASVWKFDFATLQLTLQHRVLASDFPCSALGISEDWSLIAIGFGIGSVAVYTNTLKLLRTESRHALPVTDICIYDNRKLLSSGADFYIIIGDLHRRKIVGVLWWLVPLVALFGIVLKKRWLMKLVLKISRFNV